MSDFPPSRFSAELLTTPVSVFPAAPALPSPWARATGLGSAGWEDSTPKSLATSVLKVSRLFSGGLEASSAGRLPRRARAEGLGLLLLSPSDEALLALGRSGLELPAFSENVQEMGLNHGLSLQRYKMNCLNRLYSYSQWDLTFYVFMHWFFLYINSV